MMNKCFGAGPCAKRKGWKFPQFDLAGRSHRSKEAMEFIQNTMSLHRKILSIPDDYFIGFCAASCTGGMELLMWNLLGARPVDVLSYCVFSNHWKHDIVDQLKIDNTTVISEEFPKMADYTKVNFDHDVVFCLSSTTSGVSFYNTDWIDEQRKGLTICDASSGMFVIDVDWSKLDAVAFSWQKALGGEAGVGVVVLSPRAMDRLKKFRPDRPIPRIFRIVNDGEILTSFFEGATINTPSLMCIQDIYESLEWVDRSGGLPFLINKVEENYQVICNWLQTQNVFKFLVEENIRAHHVVCLDINDSKYQAMNKDQKWKFLKKIGEIAADKQYGYDFVGHALEEPNLRIWCGPTIEAKDLEFFLQKLLEIYKEVSSFYDCC